MTDDLTPQRHGPPVDYIERTREQYSSLGYPPYRWVENDGLPPWAPLRKPVCESRLALLASGGIYARLWARQSGGFLADAAAE